MATVNRVKAILEGVCVWSYDYDDVTFVLQAFRCTNNHPTFATIGRVWDDDHPIGDPLHQEVSRTVGPMSSDVFNVPAGVAARFNLRVDPLHPSRILGMDCAFSFVG